MGFLAFYVRRSVLAIAATLVFASPTLTAKQYSFKIYSQQEGLRNQVINCLFQDHRGFLWVGTENGLFRYDGSRFALYGRAEGLPDGTVQSIHETSDGTLWVGTLSGVAKWVDKGFIPDPVLGTTKLFGFSTMVSGPGGRMYVGTARGLAVGETASGSAGTRFRFLTTQPVNGVYADPSGTIWFGSGDTLWCLKDGVISAAAPAAKLPADRWDAMLTDSSGTLWVRSSEHLFFRRPNTVAFESVPGIPHSPEFGSIYQTRDKSVFVPTAGGLMRYSANQWTKIGAQQGLAADEATCLMQDREGSVWVGLGGEGLERWLGFNQWESWKTTDGLRNNIVWDVQRDASGKLWVGTESGLHAQSPTTGDMTAQAGEGLSVRAVLDDAPHQAIWYGANPGGIFRLDRLTGRVRAFGLADGLTNNRVDKLFWDSEHNLWAATRAGLFRGQFTGDAVHFEIQHVPRTNASEGFYDAVLDRRGRLWVAGSLGLALLENGHWRRFSRSDGLNGDGVSHLTEASDGSIWMGYLSNSGISRLVFESDKPHFTHFTTQNGLTSDGTVFVGSDSRGWIWVGTDSGVDVYAHAKWRHFGKPDGLVWDDCDSLGFLAEPDGSVWIGTSGGLSRFRVSPDSPPETLPLTYITSIKAGSRFINPGNPGSIQHEDRSLLIRFAAPTYLNESAVRFRYRLVGLEKEWSDAEDRYIRYLNLTAGAYNFEVIARNAQGRWSLTPATAAFTILPPWWETWQCRALALLLLAALTHRLWKSRIRYLLSKQAVLEALLSQAQTADRLKSEAIANITKAETREKNRSFVLELIGSHQPLRSVLKAIIDMVEMDDPDTLCLILILGEGHFRYGASRKLPRSFCKQFEGLVVSSPETCFARAAFRVETVDVGDVAASTLWAASQDRLSELGIICSRSAPILSDSGDVLGTLTYFRTSPFTESSGNVCSLENAQRLTGVAIEHLSLYEQLAYRAQYDALTGLPNRALFQDRLRQAVSRAGQRNTKLWVLWLDLDGFKHVNDTLGHHAGDFLLQKIAGRLSHCVRREDLAARMGGDEFTVLIESHPQADIGALIQRLINTISEPVEFEGHQAFVTASVGVSVFPDDAQESNELLRKADLAMYHVKKVGKNTHNFFAPEMASVESNRIEIEINLRTALAGREFELFYQPQYDFAGRLMGFEALLRWNSKRLGSISPARFIPVAEESGLIIPIGQWVLEEACRQAAAWLASGYKDFRMAVNVSSWQFARLDFPETVAHLLAVTGVSPRMVELELTETAIMSDITKSSPQLRELRELGVTVSIDDFGTGYSSLSYLQRLPVDAIKIDQSFVRALCDTPASSLTMVQAIVHLAHDLNLQVIAEGVETEEQLSHLRNVGCDLAQGFLLARPLCRDDATALLARQAAMLSSEEDALILVR